MLIYRSGVETLTPNPFSASDETTWRELFNEGTGPSLISPDLAKSGNLGNLVSSETLECSDISAALWHAEVQDAVGARPRTTCWEILTVRLGKFVDEQVAKNVVVTDEMLQQYARQYWYESDDAWNQTAADNPEWLDLFKKAHGLDFLPTDIGGQGLVGISISICARAWQVS